jgi:hypothetical protein
MMHGQQNIKIEMHGGKFMKDTRELRDKNKKEAIKTISGFRNMRFM